MLPEGIITVIKSQILSKILILKSNVTKHNALGVRVEIMVLILEGNSERVAHGVTHRVDPDPNILKG